MSKVLATTSVESQMLGGRADLNVSCRRPIRCSSWRIRQRRGVDQEAPRSAAVCCGAGSMRDSQRDSRSAAGDRFLSTVWILRRLLAAWYPGPTQETAEKSQLVMDLVANSKQPAIGPADSQRPGASASSLQDSNSEGTPTYCAARTTSVTSATTSSGSFVATS